MAHKGGFKNIKLGKNVHRQIKRRGAPQQPPARQSIDRVSRLPFRKSVEVPVDPEGKGEEDLSRPEN